MEGAGAMEVDHEAPQPLRHGFSFGVLELIKSAQAQHGLRHNDYKSYRIYCSNRLCRLYKSLKFTHGRGKFVKKNLVPSVVSDVRHLHIALYSAERGWSQAMELKHKLQGKGGKERYHMLRRLRKACKWADLFESLCNEKADARTSLEATAYASYLRGILLLETGRNWKLAYRKFKNACIIYEELGKYGGLDNQLMCKERVEEIEPSVRHCQFKIEEGNTESSDDGSELNLHDKLESIMADARTQQELSATLITWLGHKYPVHNNKTRACVIQVQELEDKLAKIPAPEKKLSTYDKILAGYREARKYIEEDLAAAGNAEDMRDSLIMLDKALSCLIYSRTIEQTEARVADAKNRLKENSGLFEELVSLYDALNKNITELSDLTTSGRGKQEAEYKYAKELSAKKLFYRAERCFYLAQAYSNADKHAEAYALLGRAYEHAEEAIDLNTANEDVIKELLTQCKAQAALVHAKGVFHDLHDKETVNNGVEALSLADTKDNYLLNQLEEYKSVLPPVGSKEAPRISAVPPTFRPVPNRPIFLDTAIYTIQFPSLEARAKEKKKGLFGRWW